VILDGRSRVSPLGEHAKAVLDATLAVRTDAPFACKGGSAAPAGEGGRGIGPDGHELALEPDEIRAGYVLTCQSHPTAPGHAGLRRLTLGVGHRQI